jgi:hypothetical protein
LIDIVAVPHQGEFKKSRHWRRQSIGSVPIVFIIEKNSAISKIVQNNFGIIKIEFPDRGCFLISKRLNGKERNKFSFPFGKKNFKDFKEQL